MVRTHPVLTRRRLLAGGASVSAAAAAGGIAWLAVRHGGRSEHAVSPAPPPSPSPAATPRPRGGVARVSAPGRFSFDTFDALRSGEPSTVEILGRTHSRLIRWADFVEPRLDGDLARSWEQPDPQTLILSLDQAARWQDLPPVAGRLVAADDAVQHLQRALDIARSGPQPGLQRATDYLTIRKVSTPSPDRVVIETSRPDPFLVQTLAGRFALVQAPEAVSAFEKSWSERRAEQVIGCGPFRFDGQDSDGNLRFSAHREGHRLPPLDGIRVSEPFDEAARFLSRENDEALTRDRRDAATIRAAATELQEMRRFEDSPVITTLFVGAPPWNNFDLLKALSGALNRRELASRLFGDRAEPSSPVGPVWPAFAPSEADLASFAGFRTSFDEDAHDARAHWSAAGGAALGTVTVDFPAIFDPLYGASAVVVGMLNEVLGPQFKPAVESYITISAKALGHSYGNGEPAFWLGWGPSFSGPDPSRSLDETYRSTGPGFATTGFRSASVDRALDGVMTEFDLRTRKGATRQLALALLEAAGGGVVDWLVQRSEVFRWPYFKRSNPSPFWDQHLDAWAYLDPVGAASASRPGP